MSKIVRKIQYGSHSNVEVLFHTSFKDTSVFIKMPHDLGEAFVCVISYDDIERFCEDFKTLLRAYHI